MAGGKLYRGAYKYLRNENMYCEENFEVFKDRKDVGMNFVVQLLSRVSTGEFLKISIDYTINKNYIPQHVTIHRSLGNEKVVESYEFDNKQNKLTYTFKNKDETHKDVLSTGPIFHIATPCVCTSMLFLKSKKFNTTGKNHYTIYNGQNQWTYEGPPQTKNISVEKTSQGVENLSIDGNNLQATQYKIFEDLNDSNEEENRPFIRTYTSSHLTIPYMVRTEDGTKIQIKFLNDLTDADL